MISKTWKLTFGRRKPIFSRREFSRLTNVWGRPKPIVFQSTFSQPTRLFAAETNRPMLGRWFVRVVRDGRHFGIRRTSEQSSKEASGWNFLTHLKAGNLRARNKSQQQPNCTLTMVGIIINLLITVIGTCNWLEKRLWGKTFQHFQKRHFSYFLLS